jgi:molybdopterin molybdotransferase
MASTLSPAGVVSFDQARHIVDEHGARALAAHAGRPAIETIELPAARGRVLAEPILADRDFPPFPRATRDGYAVLAADVAQVPARLEVVGELRAGDSAPSLTVNRGQAVSIMTGAPLPAGADAVVMVEYTHATGDSVEVQRPAKSGENVVPQAAEARIGQLLIERGRRLDHALIAIAASVGKSRVQVFRKPRVAVLSTGNEVVEITASPGPAQIRNSNSYSLATQVEGAGADTVRLEIAPDEPKQLRALIEEGFRCDLLLMTGGVSMGKYDLVERVLAELGAEFYFTGAQIQPGKPIVFGSCPAMPPPGPRYFFGLPGNPVSTMVTFRLFAQPMISALAGMKPEPLVFLKARLKKEVRTKTGLTRFLPAVLSGEFEDARVELAAWQGSGDIAALAGTNCYLVVPPDRERIEAGEFVPVLLP